MYIKDPRSFAFGIIALMAVGTGISMYRTIQEDNLIKSESTRIYIQCSMANRYEGDYKKCVVEQEKQSPAFYKKYLEPKNK